MEQAQLNAVGVAVIATIVEDGVPVDVSSVSLKQLIFRKPNGVVLTKSATNVASGTDGRIQYITQAGDFDVSGQWQVQANLTFAGSFTGRSTVQFFKVKDNL